LLERVVTVTAGGEGVIARLADRAHPRAGEVAAAHLQVRNQRVMLAGTYAFHTPID
jgi:hypothetical protein